MDTATQSDMPSATPSAASDGERWISLRELAEARGVSQHSATRFVRRNGWRRQRDNRGHVLALVPIEALCRQSDIPPALAEGQPPAGPPDVAEYVAAYRTAIEAKDGEIAALRAVIEAKDSEVSTFLGMVDGLSLERDHERARADAADAGRRAAIALTEQTVTLLTDAVARADWAETATAAERQRADALGDQLAGLQHSLDTAQQRADELRGQLETAQQQASESHATAEAAQIAQSEAEADAAELRQAEAERQARGFLARLKRWRGGGAGRPAR